MLKLLTHAAAALALIASSAVYAINYDVELIIFEHTGNSAIGASDEMLMPVLSSPRRLPGSTAGGEREMQPLPELRLQQEAAQIGNSTRYRLLYHGGWRQPDFSVQDAPYVRLDFGRRLLMYVGSGDTDASFLPALVAPPQDPQRQYRERYSRTLSGGIKVWVGRFLHLDTRLAYTPGQSSRSFRIESERRMRSRQLHYIDHPRIGILAKIFPVDETAAN